jgi:hypothetical protein
MKKATVLWIILDSIFLILFNALFFVLGGTEHNLSVWLSYAFIHFAYIMLLLTPILIRKGKSTALFGVTIYSISTVYFIVALLVGVVFIFLALDGYRATLLVQLCIAGLYGIILISNMIVNERTADAEEKRQHEILYVKNASVKLKSLSESISDSEIKNKVEQVYNVLYASPVKSHPNLAEIETRILTSINELGYEVATGNKEKIISLTNSLLAAVNERNIRLKNLN